MSEDKKSKIERIFKECLNESSIPGRFMPLGLSRKGKSVGIKGLSGNFPKKKSSVIIEEANHLTKAAISWEEFYAMLLQFIDENYDVDNATVGGVEANSISKEEKM